MSDRITFRCGSDVIEAINYLLSREPASTPVSYILSKAVLEYTKVVKAASDSVHVTPTQVNHVEDNVVKVASGVDNVVSDEARRRAIAKWSSKKPSVNVTPDVDDSDPIDYDPS